MIPKMIAVDEAEGCRTEEQEPCFPQGKKAKVLMLGKEEIGLLDIVLFDEMFKSQTPTR